MNINLLINELLTYGLEKGILAPENYMYTSNALIDLFNQTEFITEITNPREIDCILNDLAVYAYDNDIIKEDNVVTFDNFKAKVIDVLIDKPQEVIRKFFNLYQDNPCGATDYLYKLSKDTNYIQTKRIAQNIIWDCTTEYGKITLTINLSKPEKDPKLIALQMNKKSGYPKCQLCKENEGYRGHIAYDSRSNMRIIPLKLNNENWYFQYSPYSYFNEHSIVLNEKHIPMIINRSTFIKLLDFLDYFPHYFIGSNAGLPIVGGSILNHEHYQAGRYRFPIEDAKFDYLGNWKDVEVGKLIWPLSTIRIKSKNKENMIELADLILHKWQSYQNEDLLIINSKDDLHNTITPISRKDGDYYIFDLILRSNYTNEEYPDGVFHPHPSLHHIKKENIGLIEAMGLGVLPARLKKEFALIIDGLEGNQDALQDSSLDKHRHWINTLIKKYDGNGNAHEFVFQEAGKVFSKVLKDAGVFKMNQEGDQALKEFIQSIIN